MGTGDNKKITVAIIDSGIDGSKSNLNDYIKLSLAFKIGDKGTIIVDENAAVKHEHGTAIAMIIQHICKDVEFISINIFDECLLSDGRILIHSLKQAIELKPDIIHLSLGTSKHRYKFILKKLMKLAEKNNIIVVSSLSNDKTRSYPADLKNVIRVAGKSFECYESFYCLNDIYYAPVDIGKIENRDELENKGMKGNSMAAAYITGNLCKLLYQNINLGAIKIRSLLKEAGDQKYKNI